MATILDEQTADDTLLADTLNVGEPMPKQLDVLPHDEILSNLDKQIALLKYQLERLEYLRVALDDPGTLDRLGLAMTHTWDEVVASYAARMSEQTAEVPDDQTAPRGPTNFDRVVVYMRSHNNEWASSTDIIAATRIKQNVLRDILYKTHKDRFERKAKPEGRGKLFRLKTQES